MSKRHVSVLVMYATLGIYPTHVIYATLVELSTHSRPWDYLLGFQATLKFQPSARLCVADQDLHEEQQALGRFWAFLFPPRRHRRRASHTSSSFAAEGEGSLSIVPRLGSRRLGGSIVAAAAAAKSLAARRPSELNDPLIP